MIPAPDDEWFALRRFTVARIALGRVGASLPTRQHLAFQLAHAQARDAVHRALDVDAVASGLRQQGNRELQVLRLQSAAADRHIYLQRPDLGRRLSRRAAQQLHTLPMPPTPPDIAIVIADGLSALAIECNALPFLAHLLPRLAAPDWRLAPIVIVQQGRVAVGDEIGLLLRASMVLVLIGERPGLSSPDSMGLYLTWAPTLTSHDAQRNCISNVRDGGLSHAEAARRLDFLLQEARRRQLSGVDLKDESGESPSQLTGASNFLLDD